METKGLLPILALASLTLSGCQSTINDVTSGITNTLSDMGQSDSKKAYQPDYAEYNEVGNLYEYQVLISSKVPINEFRRKVYQVLTEKSDSQDVWLNSLIYNSYDYSSSLSYFDNKGAFNTIIFKEDLGEGRRITYGTPRLEMSFSTEGDFHVFSITPKLDKYPQGQEGKFEHGFYYNNGQKVETYKFDFAQFEKKVKSKLSKLTNIPVSAPAQTNYSGDYTLTNDDVTAFANIQRLHNSTYLSSNKKGDSEKSGTFITNEGNIPFHFSLYPYKKVSKLKYSFDIPSEHTYYSFEKGKGETKPYSDNLDKNYNKLVLKSAVASFND
ncbi:hypothetical protein [Vibrio owensii]|uniref:hypothetical protein n=1 Tax=Vibrio owensii TaxID=696485 RepID=UPI0018F2336E|nr:hypothetical protein [Vibrio owensii]